MTQDRFKVRGVCTDTRERTGEIIEGYYLYAESAEKRAKALERAVRKYAPCRTCICDTPNNAETCGNCTCWLEGPGIDGWAFDLDRFAAPEDTP